MANPLKLLKLKPTGFQFIQELAINAPPAKVWKSLLRAEKWFFFRPEEGNKTILELFPGGRVYTKGKDGEFLFAYVTAIEPGKLLRLGGPMGMTHLPATSACIFELQPKANGKSTLLRLGQRTFGFIDKDVQKNYSRGWTELLGKLKALAEK